ncbi:hypothetical protein CR513_45726, partial [Mucuna pruriens]
MTLKETRRKRFHTHQHGEYNVRSSLYSSQHCFCGRSFGQKVGMRMIHYLNRTINYMHTYQKSNSLEIGYSDFDFVGCSDSKHSTSGYIYMLAGEAIS